MNQRRRDQRGPVPRARARPGAEGRAGPGEEAGEDHDTLVDVPGGVRLQKVLAAAGVGSRRHCEEMIADGRVEVDGEIVRRFGARVDPQRQVIRVDGRRIPAREDLVYLALNKPAGVLTTMSDTRGRPTIADFLGDYGERLFHVGPLPKDLGRRLTTGIELSDGVATADRFRVVERAGNRALVEITLHEGRKHIVRRMLAEAGHPVSRLVRRNVGPVALGSLRPGTTRRLTTREIGDLYAAVGL